MKSIKNKIIKQTRKELQITRRSKFKWSTIRKSRQTKNEIRMERKNRLV